MSRHGEGTIDWIRTVVENADWKRSATYGGGAWLAALVASFLVLTLADPNIDGGETLDAAVWATFEASGGHFDNSGNSWLIQTVYGTMDSKFWGVGAFLHYVIPALSLGVGTYLLASTALDERDGRSFEDRFEAWLVGITGAAVFGALTLVAVYAFSPSGTSPDGFRLLFAVLLYPLAIGGIGAARGVGFSIASLRAAGAGVGSFVLALFAWKFLTEPFGGNVDFGDLSGADQWLPFLGTFIADHGAYVTPGQSDFLGNAGSSGSSIPSGSSSILSGGSSLPPADMGMVGSTGPELFVLLGPLLVAAGLVYYDDVHDPLVAAGHGARVAIGYFAVTAVLTIAVLGQRMNYLYDELYGSGSEEAVREQLFQQANLMFGAVLPQLLLVVGVLTPVLLGAIGGVLSAKVQTEVLGEGTPDAAGTASSGGADVAEPSGAAEIDESAE